MVVASGSCGAAQATGAGGLTRSPVDPKFRRFMGMNRAVSNYVATDLRDGIANLLMVIDHPEFIEASNAALARIRLGHG